MELPLNHPKRNWRPGGIAAASAAMVCVLLTAATVAQWSAIIGTTRGPAGIQPLEAPVPLPRLPADWNVYVAEGFMVAAPAEWTPVQDVETHAGAGEWLEFLRPNGSVALEATTWPNQRALEVMESRVIKGARLPIERQTPNSPTILGQLVISGISWSSPLGSGTHQERKLFLQPSTEVALEVHIIPELTTSGDLEVSPADAAVQDLVATHLLLAPDTDAMIPLGRVDALLGHLLPDARRTVSAGTPEATYQTPDMSVTVHLFGSSPRRREAESSLSSRVPSVSSRGLGSVLVAVNGGDAEQRFQLLRALDALLFN